MLDEAILQETLKRYPKEISKEQLCKLCHISKRVAKYYLDNGVIPCRSNGQATHKYAIRIRDVIAFPKVQNASDLMMNCPDVVDEKQLDDLSIAVTRVEEEPAEEE